MRRWQLSRRVYCVINRNLVWASTSTASSSRAALSPQSLILKSQSFSISFQRRLYSNLCIRTSPQTQTLLVSTHQTHYTIPSPNPRRSPIISRAMSDDAYMSFLDKANADLNNARAQQPQQSSGVRTETVDVGVQIPAPLRSVDAYYISETDEPFEPVALKWEGADKGTWPGPAEFSRLISPNADISSSIETLTPSTFDPKNQYSAALRAVRAAVAQTFGGGEPGIDESDVETKVYRVEVGKSRVEYYILGLDAVGGTIVGLRAKAIES
ncbi:hypothetical protein V6Z96_006814 [Aspergillus fumigatus]